ncbi:MAG: hypothetical protein IKM34_05240 [Clostridia bacterium]|nr:hypothetical protein [Clostridia bacterium]
MRFSRVPANLYKKYFIILLCVFSGLFALEFIASMLGSPITEVTINDVRVIPETPLECLLNAAVSSLLIGGIVNVFLTLKVIKLALGIYQWPTVAVVLLTLSFPFEMLLGGLLLIPNIVFFGLKSRTRNSFGDSNRKSMF